MKVYSLSGPSGSGKSTIAIQFAHQHQIEAIIDDGILIKDGQKIAGTSAKFEKNTITAVRRAIFQEESHKDEVKEALQKYQIQSLLIIGTSDKMTKKIAEKLEVGPIEAFYHIDDIRSENEIHFAQFIRTTQGKHLMPIPYRQVEQNFFKRFIQKGFEVFTKNRIKLGETTIVQPDFQRQLIDISQNVYIDLIKYTVSQNPFVAKVDSVQYSTKQFVPQVSITIHIKAPVHYDVIKQLEEIQQKIAMEFKRHFEFEPTTIQLFVKAVVEKK